jgi:hypothetical protein
MAMDPVVRPAMSDNEIETRVYTIHWVELGKYLKRGMKMISVMQGPGAQTTMLAIVPDELVADLEKHSKRRSKPSLRDVLIDLAGWASYQRGEAKRLVLSGGLGIDVICGLDGMWRLQIWREDSPPSLKEWETVLKSWPTELENVQYTRFIHKDRQYMRGEWKKVNNEPISGDLSGGSDIKTETPAGSDGPDRGILQSE